MYEVWVMPIGVVGTEKGQASERIFKTTDTASPTAPFITNVTCYETQKIYIEWKRPSTYYKNVDFYYIYYKTTSESSYEEKVQIQANIEDDQRFFLEKENVDVENEYCMKICAGTKSTKSSAVYKGDFSDEMCVELPQIGCIPIAERELQSSLPSPTASLAPDELSAGIIVGVIAALVFVLIAALGYVVWTRY